MSDLPIAPAYPAAVRALLGQVAHHDLALDQLDHERLGSLAARLTGLVVVRDLGRCHALEPDVDAVHTMVSPSSTCARPARRSPAAAGRTTSQQRQYEQPMVAGRRRRSR